MCLLFTIHALKFEHYKLNFKKISKENNKHMSTLKGSFSITGKCQLHTIFFMA